MSHKDHLRSLDARLRIVEAELFSDAASTKDEQHESDDGKHDEDRPQHDDGDTRDFLPVHGWVCDQGGGVFQVVVDGDTYEYPTGNVTTIPSSQWGPLLASQITPEIQAVLDTLPAWIKAEQEARPGSPVARDDELALYYAASEYVRSGTPSTIDIARWAIDGDWRKVQEAIRGDAVLAIDVLVGMCDLKHRADTVFENAAQLAKCLEAIDVDVTAHVAPFFRAE